MFNLVNAPRQIILVSSFSRKRVICSISCMREAFLGKKLVGDKVCDRLVGCRSRCIIEAVFLVEPEEGSLLVEVESRSLRHRYSSFTTWSF